MNGMQLRRYSVVLAVLTGLLLWPQGVWGEDVEELLKQAEAAQSMQQYEQAVKLLQQAIQQDGQNGEIYRKLCDVLDDQSKLDESVVACRKAVELNPKSADSYFLLGFVLQKQSKQNIIEEAIAAFRKAVELNPKHTIAQDSLRLALQEHPDLKDADKIAPLSSLSPEQLPSLPPEQCGPRTPSKANSNRTSYIYSTFIQLGL